MKHISFIVGIFLPRSQRYHRAAIEINIFERKLAANVPMLLQPFELHHAFIIFSHSLFRWKMRAGAHVGLGLGECAYNLVSLFRYLCLRSK